MLRYAFQIPQDILGDLKGKCVYTIFKSPQYTGGDFMFLYRFVRRRRRRSRRRRRRRRPQILVHAITF